MKKIDKIVEDTVEMRYASNINVICNWVSPQILAVIGGRGVSKTTEIQSERMLSAIEQMPGAPVAIIAKTYSDLTNNILPAIKEGWKRKGYYEGIHYVSHARPPQKWLDKSVYVPENFAHTTFFYNGSVMLDGSIDHPSILAGKSVCYIGIDEAKHQPYAKIKKALPMLRGDKIRFCSSTLFMGMTITTDMPDISEGEDDWIFTYAKQMDIERISLIINTFSYLNQLKIELVNELNGLKRRNVLFDLTKKIEEWELRLRKVRHEQVFFMNVSSFFNIEHLTVGYIKNMLTTLDIEDFNKSICGIRPVLRKNMRFYINLNDKNFYTDGINEEFLGQFNFNETPNDCRKLVYLNRKQKLEGGYDDGAYMKSFVFGQPQGDTYRVLKNLYVLTPKSYRELADSFLTYFKYQEIKELDLYYDRAANAREALKEDAAGKLKQVIEFDKDGKRTGWIVNLKSRNQGNIEHQDEYDLMIELMSGKQKGLPKLLIDAIECRQLKSSLEKAPAKIFYEKKKKIVKKEKKSERLSPQRLPMESTNFSDSFKYLMCRAPYLGVVKYTKKHAIVGTRI